MLNKQIAIPALTIFKIDFRIKCTTATLSGVVMTRHFAQRSAEEHEPGPG